jgi:hypothetical protein
MKSLMFLKISQWFFTQSANQSLRNLSRSRPRGIELV